MHYFKAVGNVIAILMYVPLCIQILKGGTKQNFTTWILWGTLDAIVAASLFFQHGNYWLPLIYVIGSTTTAICIFGTAERKWTWFDTSICALAAACMVIWALSGPYIATIASSTAVSIATIPLLVESYREPHEVPAWIYTGFLAANIFNILGGKEWSVIDRFYPLVAAILCALIVGLGLRRFSQEPLRLRRARLG